MSFRTTQLLKSGLSEQLNSSSVNKKLNVDRWLPWLCSYSFITYKCTAVIIGMASYILHRSYTFGLKDNYQTPFSWYFFASLRSISLGAIWPLLIRDAYLRYRDGVEIIDCGKKGTISRVMFNGRIALCSYLYPCRYVDTSYSDGRRLYIAPCLN